MDKDDVIAWRRQQPDKTFFEVVYEGAIGRGPDKHDPDWLESRIVAGYAIREREDGVPGNRWRPQLVALPRDPAPWRSDADAILCQSGSHCEHELISWAKEIHCPLCGGDAYAT